MAKYGTGKKMNTKMYDSSSNDKKENERLKSQAGTIEVFDTNVIKEFVDAIKKSGKKQGETIYILELGGADMKGATISRYNDNVLNYINQLGYKVKIVNAEYNEKAVQTATEIFGNKYTNVCVDLNNDPEMELNKLVKEHTNNQKFDMIFSNYVLQHLVAPQTVMKAVKKSLSKNGISMHRVPDDRLKVKGFYTKGKPNETAIQAATEMVRLFLTSLEVPADRKLGNKMFDICGDGYQDDKGVDYNNIYDRIATEIIPASADDATKIKYLERDFKWYFYALEGAGKVEEAAKAKQCYETLVAELLKKDSAYRYSEHEVIVSNELELTCDINNAKSIDKYRSVKIENARVNGYDLLVEGVEV